MSSFLPRLSFRLGHVSDETLARLLSGELSSYRTMRVNGHLSRCWECRARREELERATLLVVEYRRGNQVSCLPLDPNSRRSFLARVDEVVGTPGSVPRWPRPILPLRRSLHAMNPVFASVVILAVASVLLVWIWQRSATTVSARELLRRAEVSEGQRSAQHTSDVLYQQVSVRVGKSTVRHAIYRDLSGRRHAHKVALSPDETQVQKTLETAGVDWEAPLSARDFQQWHDRQAEPRDEVERTGQSELTLTTTISSGNVTQESLTVREGDFHPIRRVVEMRGQETIEVAELDYAILGWPAVNQALFEPLANVAGSGELAPTLPSLHAALPRVLPTPVEIDVAEVAARTVLAQLETETGDQIRILHDDAGIVVKGIVATNQRKRMLVEQLKEIAYVHPEFLSTEEMESRPVNGASSALYSISRNLVQTVTASDALAPLARFLNDKQASPEQLSTLSKQLLDASLRVQQSGAQFLELEDRFASPMNLPDASRMQLENLVMARQKEMEQGLKAELAALAEAGLAEAGSMRVPTQLSQTDRTAFRQSITQNQQYCQELIAAPLQEPRPASVIAADIQSSIDQIQATLTGMAKPSPQP